MKRKICSIVFAVAILASSIMSVIIPMSDIMVSATSPMPSWNGVTANGTILTKEYTDLEFQKQKITYDLPDFPIISYYYDNVEELKNYAGKVTTEVTLSNPTNETIRTMLYVPFGQYPTYISGYDYQNEMPYYFLDTDKYNVKINGYEITKRLRYTSNPYYNAYDYQQIVTRLQDTFVDDPFFSHNLTVTKYTYSLTEIEDVEPTGFSHSAYAVAFLPNSNKNRKFLIKNASFDNDYFSNAMFSWVGFGGEVEMYVFGDPLTEDISWKFYKDRQFKTEQKGKMTLQKTESTTFYDFAYQNYSESYGYSEIDWYNELVFNMNRNTGSMEGVIFENALNFFRYEGLRWWEYGVEIAANDSITVQLIAPAYPRIEDRYTPYVYEYSNAVSEYNFTNLNVPLEIEINTPYYLINDSLNFVKNEKGYSLSLTSIPTETLYFSLSTSENPEVTIDPTDICASCTMISLLSCFTVVGCGAECVDCMASGCVSLTGGSGLLLFGISSMVLLITKRRKK